MSTSTITFRVSSEERWFFEKMAQFNGMTLSEMVRTKTLEALEDQYDLHSHRKAMEAHRRGDESISHSEMKALLGL